jgi:hypothetical protein
MMTALSVTYDVQDSRSWPTADLTDPPVLRR